MSNIFEFHKRLNWQKRCATKSSFEKYFGLKIGKKLGKWNCLSIKSLKLNKVLQMFDQISYMNYIYNDQKSFTDSSRMKDLNSYTWKPININF